MASVDEEEQSPLSINDLSDGQIRRRLTQEFNLNPVINNLTRPLLLKKLQRLENKRNSFQDSFSAPATADDGDKEKENFSEQLNFAPPKRVGKNLNDTFDQESFDKEDNEEQILKQSPLAKIPQICTPKKAESPTKVKERKLVRIDETLTEITTSNEFSEDEEDVSDVSHSSNLSPTVSSNDYFKRPQCRPPIRRSTSSAYELDDSKKRRSSAVSPVSVLFSFPYFLVTIAVLIALLVIFYMYLF